MRWQGRRKSTNIVNQRGNTRGSSHRFGVASGGAGGLLLTLIRFVFNKFGITGIAVLGAAYLGLRALNIDPLELLNTAAVQPGSNSSFSAGQAGAGQPAQSGLQTPADEFIAVVLASTEDVWNAEFQKRGTTYTAPKLNLFADTVLAGGCGYASAAVGPFYCPSNREVYLDTSFFDDLASKFGAAGDFARAYVIAHEVGHHIQTLAGTTQRLQRARGQLNTAEGNKLLVSLELQADCLAGVWAHHENKMYMLEPGDIAEALEAASAIGDDTLQRKATGRVMPESFTHGTSAQRMRWFRIGYEAGVIERCSTFSQAEEGQPESTLPERQPEDQPEEK